MIARLPFTLLVLLLTLSGGAQEQQTPPAPAQEQTTPEQAPPVPEPAVRRREKDPPREVRHHFLLRHAGDKVEHYRATNIVRITDDVQQNVLLLHDLEHGRLILEDRHLFASQDASYSISDEKRAETVEVSFKTPYTASTRKDTEEEDRVNPGIKNTSALLTITTNGGEWRSSDSEWTDWRRIRELRYSIRRTLSPFLLEAVERMRGTVFATDQGEMYYFVVGRYLVYQDKDDVPLALEAVTLPPGCEFDESFGYPCSAEQQKRIRDAVQKGKVLPRY
jgi:hypothetical protein